MVKPLEFPKIGDPKMPGFDDLLRRAKEVVGEETVNEIVREVEKRSKFDTREIVNVEMADLSPLVNKIAQAASEKPDAAGELLREVVQNLETPGSPNRTGRPQKRKNKSQVVPNGGSAKPVPAPPLQTGAVSQVGESKEQIEEAKQVVTQPAPATSGTAMVISESIKGEYRYAMLGLVLGLSAIIGGVILGLNGVAGSTSWTANLLALKSQINDAAPGVVLFIVGLFMIVATRPKVNLKDLKG
jgi:hypothetical protein